MNKDSPVILYEDISGVHCLCERFKLSAGLSSLFWLSSNLGPLHSLFSAQATEESQNVFSCSGKCTGHNLFNYGYSSDMIHSKSIKPVPGSQNEWGEITCNIQSSVCEYKPQAFLAQGPLFIMKENLKAKVNYSHDLTIWHTC